MHSWRAALVAACLLVSTCHVRAQSQFLPLLFNGDAKLTEEQAASVVGEPHAAPVPAPGPSALSPPLLPPRRSAACRARTSPPLRPAPGARAGVWEQVDGFRLDGSVLDDAVRAAAEAAGTDAAASIDFEGGCRPRVPCPAAGACLPVCRGPRMAAHHLAALGLALRARSSAPAASPGSRAAAAAAATPAITPPPPPPRPPPCAARPLAGVLANSSSPAAGALSFRLYIPAISASTGAFGAYYLIGPAGQQPAVTRVLGMGAATPDGVLLTVRGASGRRRRWRLAGSARCRDRLAVVLPRRPRAAPAGGRAAGRGGRRGCSTPRAWHHQ